MPIQPNHQARRLIVIAGLAMSSSCAPPTEPLVESKVSVGEQLDKEGLTCPAGFRRLSLRVAQMQSDKRGGVWIAEADAPTAAKSRKATWIWHYDRDLSRSQAWKLPQDLALESGQPIYFAEHRQPSPGNPGVFEMLLADKASYLFSAAHDPTEETASNGDSQVDADAIALPSQQDQVQVVQQTISESDKNFRVKWSGKTIDLSWPSAPKYVAAFADNDNTYSLISASTRVKGFGKSCDGTNQKHHLVWVKKNKKYNENYKIIKLEYIHS